MLSLVVAFDEMRGIGKKGWMPWHLPEDLAVFKKITLNHDIIMGHKTFQGLKKPLPKRHTYVLTRQIPTDKSDDNVTYCDDIEALIHRFVTSDNEVFVCGGAQIYQRFLPYCQKMYISHVEGIFAADTYFPEYNEADFVVISCERYDGFTHKVYQRKLGDD